MLDLRYIREHADEVREGARKKRIPIELDKLLALDEESRKLTFRAELYNVTNTPRFGFPTRDLQSAVFGRITTTYNPQNFVGASRQDDTQRVVQLALRYTF